MSIISYKVIPDKTVLSIAVVRDGQGKEVARVVYVGGSEGMMGAKQLPTAVTLALTEYFSKIFAHPIESRPSVSRSIFEVEVVDHKTKFVAQLKSKISKGEVTDFQAGNTLISEFMRGIVDIPFGSDVRGQVSDALLATLRKSFPGEARPLVAA